MHGTAVRHTRRSGNKPASRNVRKPEAMRETLHAFKFLFTGPLILLMLYVINQMTGAESPMVALGRARHRDRLGLQPAAGDQGGRARRRVGGVCGVPDQAPSLTSFLRRGDRAVVLQRQGDERLRPAEWEFRQVRLFQLEAEPGLVAKRVIAVDHAHGREAQPLFPHLLFLARLDTAADFLHQEVRHRGVDVD